MSSFENLRVDKILIKKYPDAVINDKHAKETNKKCVPMAGEAIASPAIFMV